MKHKLLSIVPRFFWIGLIALLLAVPVSAAPGGPSGNGVSPVEYSGNPSCSTLLNSGDFLFEFKLEPVASGTYPLSFNGLSGDVTVTVNNTPQGQTFDFSFSGDFVAAGVIVKGGPNANFYDYRPDGEDADTGLHAPVNPSNGRFYGLSHISFCIMEAQAELEITKTAVDDTITIGDRAAFDITVTNLGPATAQNVTIDDELPNGDLDWEIVSEDIAGACSITSGNTLHCDVGDLAPDASFSVRVQTTTTMTSAECDRVLDNTAFADADNADEVNDDATITVECAAIQIEKRSTKSGNPLVSNAGAVFSYDSSSVTDNGAGDEDPTTGVVCVSGLAVGTYTVNETTPPSGYGDAGETDVSVDAVAGTNCSANLPSGSGIAVFTNPPLYDLQVNFRDAGSGETSVTSITCVDIEPADSTTPATGWDASSTYLNEEAPDTVVCTIVIDP
jgi:uncharacterized repeat protein (TIGR01451 family)